MVSINKEMKDPRSTGRRKARRELFNSRVPFKCADCGLTTKSPPKDAPLFFDEIWPTTLRVLESQLQADHETKDLEFNDLSALNWRCPSCHKLRDMKTDPGVSTLMEGAMPEAQSPAIEWW